VDERSADGAAKLRYVEIKQAGTQCPVCNRFTYRDRVDDRFFCLIDACKFNVSRDEMRWRMKERLRSSVPDAVTRAPSWHPVVYYVRFRDCIKIGTTINTMSRFPDLPIEEVVAFEPGDFAVERRRHAQFAASRVVGEWFEITPELLAHCAGLTVKYENHARTGKHPHLTLRAA
jgi:hypothetical protein